MGTPRRRCARAIALLRWGITPFADAPAGFGSRGRKGGGPFDEGIDAKKPERWLRLAWLVTGLVGRPS